MNKNENNSEVLYWSARKMNPKIILYVAIIFFIIIAVIYFTFYSISAIKALTYTALGTIVSLVPGVLSSVEYRLTIQKLEYRPIKKGEEKPYKILFFMNQLSYIVQIESGFKYYLTLNEKKSLRRLYKKYFSDHYSGGVRIEKNDTERIMTYFKTHGILIKSKFQKVID